MHRSVLYVALFAIVLAIGCDTPEVTNAKVENAKGADAAPVKTYTAQGGPTVGEEAPEIVGVDLDGVEFKLSDYRGKVVMLSFYGNW